MLTPRDARKRTVCTNSTVQTVSILIWSTLTRAYHQIINYRDAVLINLKLDIDNFMRAGRIKCRDQWHLLKGYRLCNPAIGHGSTRNIC